MKRIVRSACVGIAVTSMMIGKLDCAEAAAASPPPDAVAAGYTQNTFSAFTPGSIDINDTGKSGFSWYPWHYFGRHAQPQNIVVNPDGSVTFNGDTTGPNGQLTTAAPAKNAQKFVGVAFGGGAYIEASLKFDPVAAHDKSKKGWPSFWAMSLEHMATSSALWAGKEPNYEHFIEVDFFEYDIAEGGNYYGATMHDWYGVYNKTCAGRAFCSVGRAYSDVKTAVRSGTDFTQYHTYGFLWVPATGSATGYGQFYFDRTPVGKRVSWTKIAGQDGLPDQQPWQFGILDNHHLVLILGTGVGKPMTVASVNVWQSSNSQNLRN
jgi:hypothetical protein